MVFSEIASGALISAYLLAGSTSWGYIFLRIAWPKVRSKELAYKSGWSVITGLVFSVAAAGFVSLIFFLDLSLWSFPETLFLGAIVFVATGIAVSTLRRKFWGPKKVVVGVPKRAVYANIAARKAFEKVPENSYIKVSGYGIEKLERLGEKLAQTPVGNAPEMAAAQSAAVEQWVKEKKAPPLESVKQAEEGKKPELLKKPAEKPPQEKAVKAEAMPAPFTPGKKALPEAVKQSPEGKPAMKRPEKMQGKNMQELRGKFATGIAGKAPEKPAFENPELATAEKILKEVGEAKQEKDFMFPGTGGKDAEKAVKRDAERPAEPGTGALKEGGALPLPSTESPKGDWVGEKPAVKIGEAMRKSLDEKGRRELTFKKFEEQLGLKGEIAGTQSGAASEGDRLSQLKKKLESGGKVFPEDFRPSGPDKKNSETTGIPGGGGKNRDIDSIISALEKSRAGNEASVGTREQMREKTEKSQEFIRENMREKMGPVKPAEEVGDAGGQPEKLPKSAKLLKELLKNSEGEG
ncbi:MAG TPA: hypothetical protein VFF09_00715 [archaeon]|nr:hypothetical protein [archaeon]